jgi:hypothetical protein
MEDTTAMELIPLVGIIASTAMWVLIVYFISKARQRRVEAQVQMQMKLIERFGSASEMVEFLKSPAGREFVTGVSTAPKTLARERAMRGMTAAIVLSMLGLSFIFLTIWWGDGFVIPAAIISALGLGFLVATIVTWKLSARMDQTDHA